MWLMPTCFLYRNLTEKYTQEVEATPHIVLKKVAWINSYYSTFPKNGMENLMGPGGLQV